MSTSAGPESPRDQRLCQIIRDNPLAGLLNDVKMDEKEWWRQVRLAPVLDIGLEDMEAAFILTEDTAVGYLAEDMNDIERHSLAQSTHKHSNMLRLVQSLIRLGYHIAQEDVSILARHLAGQLSRRGIFNPALDQDNSVDQTKHHVVAELLTIGLNLSQVGTSTQ